MQRRSFADDRGAVLTPDELGERDLLTRIARADVRAFEELYRRYHVRITRFVWRLTRRATLADEVVNDTMFVVWTRPDAFNGTSKLSSWIYGIAYRKALKALAKQDAPLADDRAEAHDAPELRPADVLSARSLLRFVQELSPDHRAVVELTYFHDFDYREIAEIMACPVDTIKSRMFYARRHLARLIPGDASDWL